VGGGGGLGAALAARGRVTSPHSKQSLIAIPSWYTTHLPQGRAIRTARWGGVRHGQHYYTVYTRSQRPTGRLLSTWAPLGGGILNSQPRRVGLSAYIKPHSIWPRDAPPERRWIRLDRFTVELSTTQVTQLVLNIL